MATTTSSKKKTKRASGATKKSSSSVRKTASKKTVPKKTEAKKRVAKKSKKAETKKAPSTTKDKKNSVKKKDTSKNPDVKKVTTRSAKNAKPTKTIRRVRVYKELDPHEYFWVNNGPAIADLHSLANTLSEISDEQFAYHAFEREDNDFARWVQDVFEEDALAQRLRRSRSRAGARRVVIANVSLYP